MENLVGNPKDRSSRDVAQPHGLLQDCNLKKNECHLQHLRAAREISFCTNCVTLLK